MTVQKREVTNMQNKKYTIQRVEGTMPFSTGNHAQSDDPKELDYFINAIAQELIRNGGMGYYKTDVFTPDGKITLPVCPEWRYKSNIIRRFMAGEL